MSIRAAGHADRGELVGPAPAVAACASGERLDGGVTFEPAMPAATRGTQATDFRYYNSAPTATQSARARQGTIHVNAEQTARDHLTLRVFYSLLDADGQ